LTLKSDYSIRRSRVGSELCIRYRFIIGYNGMIDLAIRSGHIQSIYAHAVYENDEFESELGLHPGLKHKPSFGERGAFIG
ncbi:recombinase RecT, partial [Bacillus cereus group sp. N8]|uniref:recombinase RecT n=1 Tax=Bacillus cereus group sp. N8 TaxID=2794584 RepID=UPI0018F74704